VRGTVKRRRKAYLLTPAEAPSFYAAGRCSLRLAARVVVLAVAGPREEEPMVEEEMDGFTEAVGTTAAEATGTTPAEAPFFYSAGRCCLRLAARVVVLVVAEGVVSAGDFDKIIKRTLV
jgi:hypothetical protein